MTVLVPYDGSQPAQQAVDHAITNWGDEEIVLLGVIEAADGIVAAGVDLLQEWLKEQREEGPTELGEGLRERIRELDIEFRIETVVGKPTEQIVAFAAENEVDHIIMGSHGRKGASRVLLGSVAENVVRESPTTVTVVR